MSEIKNENPTCTKLHLTKTSEITNPTYYVEAISKEYADFALDEDRATQLRGEWRSKAFSAPNERPMDLEIGTGHGVFFAHRAVSHPERNLIGVELKFKPLIQAIRRALNKNAQNMRIVRYHANFIDHLFAPNEIDHVFIHHPDPWTKRRKHKRRLMQSDFLDKLHVIQRKGSYLDFKTDSEDYFHWAVEKIKKSQYQITRYSEDLHKSEWSSENIITQFEKIYLSKGQPIFYLRALKANEPSAPQN